MGRRTTLQIQTLLIMYSGWLWSGSIGFAAGAPPRSDPHAEILANMEPLRQKNVWVHQNVTAILTAVHAPGSLVLLVNPPYSFAIHWDFVQDFLSNRATYGLWVDACRFDVDVVKTWLFAPSSLELLPLASHCNHEFQCKNTRHPRMRDPHTKFPPALCAKFARRIVPFCESGLSGGLHALDRRRHSEPSNR